LADNRQLIIAQNLSAYSDYGGLTMFESTNNAIANSRICNNTDGVSLYHSDNNRFYHNSFVNNSRQVFSDCYVPFYLSKYRNLTSGYFSACNWNNSVEGNYWSDYNGADSNGDGIGDTPYIVDANNTDHDPLMSPYWYWSNPASYDLNRDMKVDMKDVGSAAACFGTRAGDSKWNPLLDITGDGEVNVKDLVAIAKHFGEHYRARAH
jgi:parallel beta-helix repeat protein